MQVIHAATDKRRNRVTDPLEQLQRAARQERQPSLSQQRPVIELPCAADGIRAAAAQ